ncbi:hypothetical protein ABEB36_014742 [Hypothenemus hampei]|uniref:Small ribosomal subunit protein uS7 domain-containing protein n=1 Tax=Hypothenemus hampei TaxID=57062 RepID=A0ABD1E2Q6_HYPHA
MAGINSLFKTKILLKPNTFSAIVQNGMAIFPSYYIEPIYKKEDQEALKKSGEISEYVHMPTKAALNSQTCSVSYDPILSLFTNYLMRKGQKELARNLVERSLEQVKRIQLERYHKCNSDEERAKIELNPKIIFHRAVENGKPLLQLMPVKRGGVKYQVPVPISEYKARFLSMNWLIEAGREKDRTKVRFWTQLARELVDASNNTGKVVRRKQELHKQCEANKAYAHYRWS